MKNEQLLRYDCFWVQISFLMLTWLSSITTKHLCSLSVVVVSVPEPFLLISSLTSRRLDVRVHAGSECVGLRQFSDFWMEAHSFSPDSFLKTFATLHCVFLINWGHITAGGLFMYRNRKSKSAKIRKRIMRTQQNNILNNCEGRQPLCAMLRSICDD